MKRVLPFSLLALVAFGAHANTVTVNTMWATEAYRVSLESESVTNCPRNVPMRINRQASNASSLQLELNNANEEAIQTYVRRLKEKMAHDAAASNALKEAIQVIYREDNGPRNTCLSIGKNWAVLLVEAPYDSQTSGLSFTAPEGYEILEVQALRP